MNQRNQKKPVLQVNASKSVAFSSHFLVISGQKSEEFYSLSFVNLR
jgi:hypothetical protein